MTSKLKVKKTKEKKIIWTKFKHYIDFVILACCFIIAINIHPSSNNVKDENNPSETHTMIYIFHDYEWNEYIMNDHTHGASNYRDYLFEDDVPDELKWEEKEFKDSVSLSDLTDNQQSDFDNTEKNNFDDVKDNQISLDDIISDLWEISQDTELSQSDTNKTDPLVIEIWDNKPNTNDINENYYTVKEEKWSWDSSYLIIEKINNENEITNDNEKNQIDKTTKIDDSKDDNLPVIKVFTFVEEGLVLPTLIPRNNLYFGDNNQSIDYNSINWNWGSKQWITIIEDYADCMTPRWYKIVHWDSVLAYKQMDDTPDICNIERRFCWKWKLSGTYTQQWCSVNKNYTYEQRWEIPNTTTNTDNNFKWWTRQNSNWSVSVRKTEIWWEFVFDKPNKTYSDFNESDNIRIESPWVEQTSRVYPDCTAPRWEKVKHWQFIQAFKHANWFSDSPCETQIRLCSMWKLMWTYTESTCKTRDTSFIDWINGSPTRKTYSEEKLELVKKQIAAEEAYYEDSRKNGQKSTDSDALDRILYILDQD